MLTIRPRKTRLYQGFLGPFSGWAVCFYGLPGIGPFVVNITGRDFGTICPKVRLCKLTGRRNYAEVLAY